MKIIIALGNPGENYINTRHNIGWLYFDFLLKEVSWQENKKWGALYHKQDNYLYIKPLSFMNNSGQVVKKVLDYYKLIPKNFGLLAKKDSDLSEVLLVIHDELDLDFGSYKLANNSGSAGHKGVQSIINILKTKNFQRLRLGIKNDLLRQHIPPDKFVLQKFSSLEKEKLSDVFSVITKEFIN